MLRKLKRILEIGIVVGFLVLFMYIGFFEVRIIIIEMDFDMVMEVKKNIKEFGV